MTHDSASKMQLPAGGLPEMRVSQRMVNLDRFAVNL
jgi:hypothetical protein